MLSIFFEVIWKFTKFKVLFYLKRSKGKSVEADRINRHLDNIRAQINQHYQSISDQDSFISAEKVKNAYLGFGDKYRMLLEAFEKFTCDYQKRIGIRSLLWSLEAIPQYYRPFACFHAKKDWLAEFRKEPTYLFDILTDVNRAARMISERLAGGEESDSTEAIPAEAA